MRGCWAMASARPQRLTGALGGSADSNREGVAWARFFDLPAGGSRRETSVILHYIGLRKRSVMRSLSPMASYLAWSNAGLGVWPLGALCRVGGSVHTPKG